MKDQRFVSFHSLTGLTSLVLVAAVLAACGGGSSLPDTSSALPPPIAGSGLTGTITTSISDPPTCKGPLAPSDLKFENVWVTITLVRAHISDGAEDGDGEWVDLTELDPPMQIDLLNLGNGNGGDECALATLGILDELPAGDYGQIRLHLLANDASEGPAENACEAVDGFNCAMTAELSGGELKLLNLSSQANTGIKIPPGQMPDGGLSLEEGESANINIEFNACRSIVEQGNGGLRLKPTLHAGEIGVVDTLSGSLVKVVGEGEEATTEAFTDVTGLVFLEQVDEGGIGRVIMELQTEPDGSFNLCPVPEGDFDVVAAAKDNSGVTYNATVTLGVSAGAAIGEIPMVPETGTDTGPGTINGEVSTTSGSPSTAVIVLSPLQDVSSDASMLMTIPTFGESPLTFTTVPHDTDGAVCTDTTGTNCFNYTLMVPASDPQVGTFSADGTEYAPANDSEEVEYQVLAEAFVPDTEEANCDPSSLIADEDDAANTLAVTAGTPVTAERLDFTGCAGDP
jgi:hypothetical protein